jgi:hypothetical protein
MSNTNTALDRRRDDTPVIRADAIESRVIESVIVRGDISALSPNERATYYVELCKSLGLSAAAQPFAPLKLNGKEILYPTRGATDQLAAMHRINREIIDGPRVIDVAGTKLVFAVCRATHPNGRTETATATVPLVDPANVLMKCETKAKRRATLSILGLGMLDETEVDSIPDSAKSEALPIKVEAAKPSRSKLSDEEKNTRVAAIIDEYRAALARDENADAAYDAAKKRGRDEGVATLVQDALQREMSADAERKRAEYDEQQAAYSRLVSELDSAETSAAVIAVWTDNAAAIKQLPEQHRRQAWSETVARWSAVGGEGKGQGLRDALNERGEP